MKKVEENTLGARIRERRNACGFTQQELADKIYCKKAQISQYETNENEPKLSVIRDMAAVLGTTVGYLMDGEVAAEMTKEEQELIKKFRSMTNPAQKEAVLNLMRTFS